MAFAIFYKVTALPKLSCKFAPEEPTYMLNNSGGEQASRRDLALPSECLSLRSKSTPKVLCFPGHYWEVSNLKFRNYWFQFMLTVKKENTKGYRIPDRLCLACVRTVAYSFLPYSFLSEGLAVSLSLDSLQVPFFFNYWHLWLTSNDKFTYWLSLGQLSRNILLIYITVFISILYMLWYDSLLLYIYMFIILFYNL